MMWIPSLLSQAATLLPYLPLFLSRNTPARLDPPADPRFPVNHPSLSYWLQSVRNDPLLDRRTTESLPATSDVVVIGSGLAGSLIAYSLLHSDSANTPTSVTLLEAREFCSGATGRNAGHCKPDQYRGFLKYASQFGKEEAKNILENEWETFTRLVDFVRKEEVDCDLWVGDTLDVAMSENTLERSKEAFRAYVEYAGEGIKERVKEVLDVKEAEKISRLKGAKGVWAWHAASMHPWKLAGHLAKQSLKKGLNIQTQTRVTSINHAPNMSSLWQVHTPRGSIITPIVIHATNAFASTLLPQLESILYPTPFICTKMVPPLAYSGSKALQNTYGVFVSDDAMFSINPRTTSDGAVLFGGEGPNQRKLVELVDKIPTLRGDDRIGNFKPISDAVEDFVERHFVGWGGKEEASVGEGLDYNWSGVLGMTTDGLPFAGRVPGLPGQFIAAGFNGHGMARIFSVAPAVAKLVLNPEMTYNSTGIPGSFEMSERRLAKLL